MSELRMRSILETAADAIITSDEAGTILEFNQAAERIFGVAAARRDRHPVHRSAPRRRPTSACGRARRSARCTHRRADRDRDDRRADGEEFEARISISATTIDGRTLTTAIVRDVTKEKEAARALEQRGLYDELTGSREPQAPDRPARRGDPARRKRRRTVVGVLAARPRPVQARQRQPRPRRRRRAARGGRRPARVRGRRRQHGCPARRRRVRRALRRGPRHRRHLRPRRAARRSAARAVRRSATTR